MRNSTGSRNSRFVAAASTLASTAMASSKAAVVSMGRCSAMAVTKSEIECELIWPLMAAEKRLKHACFSHVGLVMQTIFVMGIWWESLPMESVARSEEVTELDAVLEPLTANAYALEKGDDMVGC